MELSKYLDNRNKALWEFVCKTYLVNVSYHDEKSYGLFRINNNATIFVPKTTVCIDSFTHELLHLWMDIRDVSVSRTLSSTFKTDPFFSLLFKPELGEHIGNCADHYKMLPIYLEMGFDRAKFIEDYNSTKCNKMDMSFIEGWYNHEDIISRRYAAENYIATYFSIKACPNPQFEYKECLNRLRQIDSKHYKILEEFWLAFEHFDITQTNSIFNSYRTFTYPFTESLKRHLVLKFSS